MAERKLEVEYKWENNNYLKITEQYDDGEKVLILECTENNHMMDSWDAIRTILQTVFNHHVKTIHDEMAS